MTTNRSDLLREHLARLATALRFLTIFPVSYRAEGDGGRFSKCLGYFPIVGLCIGLVGALLVFLIGQHLPHEILAIICVIYPAVITGGLHLDGLADSGDGLLSHRPKQESLRIMKDSRIGAMGVIVLLIVLLLKLSGFQAMGIRMPMAMLLMPIAGRCAILFTMAWLPYAREEGGIGALFYSKSAKKAAVLAFLFLLLISGIVAPGMIPLLLLFVLLTCFMFNRWCLRRLGGATGDTLGAVCELTEAAVVLACSIYVTM